MMALCRGYSAEYRAEGYTKQRGPFIYSVRAEQRSVFVIIDDDPVCVVRHRVFLKGMGNERATCAGMNPRENKRPCPTMCLGCNAELTPRSPLGRKTFWYITVVCEDHITSKAGQEYQDLPYLMEFNEEEVKAFLERKNAEKGSLVGHRIQTYRTKKPGNSRNGDMWVSLGVVDPVRHFWYSPAIQRTIDFEVKKGNPPPAWESVVRALVKPIDYEEVIGKYDKDMMQAMVDRAFAEAGMAVRSEHAMPPPPPGAGNVYANAIPATQMPTYSQVPRIPGPPDATVPAVQAQASPPPPPPPAAQPVTVGTTSSYAPPPPPPPQAVGVAQQQQQQLPPPPPAVPAVGSAPLPPPPPPPALPMPAAQAPAVTVGDQYSFEQRPVCGWSSKMDDF